MARRFVGVPFHARWTPMLIRDVEFVGLRSALPRPAQFSWGSADSRNVGLVRVTTDEGISGTGETSVTFPLWSLEERALTVREGLRPLVLGKDAGDIDGLVESLNRTLGRLAPLWSAVAIQASIGAFEVALWDIRGKVEGRPLWQGLGGQPVDDGVPLYAVGFGGEPEQVAELAAATLNEGYASIKVRVGFGRERDLALLAAVTKAIPETHRVLVDANMAWSREEAREMVPLVAGYGVGWIEEPVVWSDLEGLAELRELATVPVAAGENAYGRAEALRLIEAEAVDVVMPDIARCGGLGSARAMVAAARERCLAYSPHQYASEVGFVTCLHLCAAEPGYLHVLRDISPWPLRHEVLTEPLRIAGGRAWLPAGPGLGVEIDEAALQRHRIV